MLAMELGQMLFHLYDMFLMNLNYFLECVLPNILGTQICEPNVDIKHNCFQVKMWSVMYIPHTAECSCFTDCKIAADSFGGSFRI